MQLSLHNLHPVLLLCFLLVALVFVFHLRTLFISFLPPPRTLPQGITNNYFI